MVQNGGLGGEPHDQGASTKPTGRATASASSGDGAGSSSIKEESKGVATHWFNICLGEDQAIVDVEDVEKLTDQAPVKAEKRSPPILELLRNGPRNGGSLLEVPDSPEKPSKRRKADLPAWAGSNTTNTEVERVPGCDKCLPSALWTLGKLVSHPCAQLLDACFDDQDGPFTLRQVMDKTNDVKFPPLCSEGGTAAC